MWCPMSISFCPSAVYCYCMLLSHVCGTWSTCSRFLVMWYPMSISLCPSAVHCYFMLLSDVCGTCSIGCLFCNVLPHGHFIQSISMLSFYVRGTWSICCLTGNAMPHVCFTLSISCLLLCCHSMCVALGPFAVLLVMMSHVSFTLPKSCLLLCCFLSCYSMPHVCFTLSISCLLLCCCPVSVALGPFLPVMSYPISVSLCPSAV